MYDYVDGKVDWMAFGLPVEGADGPFAGDSLAEVPTLRPDEAVAGLAARLRGAGEDRAVVVNEDRVVLGVVEARALEEGEPGARAGDVMALAPPTVRPSVLLADLDETGLLVTTPDGRLLGAVSLAGGAGSRPDLDRLESLFHETLDAVQEHFGAREPGEEELRAFLRERLTSEGRTPEQADGLLAAMDQDSGDHAPS